MSLFHDLCGNEHAKRAAEVALVGGYRVVFVGPWDSQAADFTHLVNTHARIANDNWPPAQSWSPCACGYYGTTQCTCSLDSVAMYRESNPLPLADIYVEVVQPSPEKLLRWAMNNFRDGQSHGEIMARIEQAQANNRPCAPHNVKDVAWHLLRAAASSLHMQPATFRNTIEVAATIAQMAGSVAIETAHMAEAIQYRPRENNDRA